MVRRLFIAATRQNEGKTTLALGLILALKKRYKNIGFIKPVGQRYVQEGAIKVDEDSILIERACAMDCFLKDMSPIAVEKNFTREYLLHPDPKPFIRQIQESFAKVAEGKDMVIIEGTGHAGVGSVFDLSNATVAKILEAPVIIVSSGGIGRPIDEIALNQSLFKEKDVSIIGAIINKILPEKLSMVKEFLARGLSRLSLDFLGVIPLERYLSSPTIEQIVEDCKGEVLNGRAFLKNAAEKIVIGAMTPHSALDYFAAGTLVITPGDREDIILAALGLSMTKVDVKKALAGLVLTGGIRPHRTIMDLIKKTELPVVLVEEDSYSAASKVHDLVIKLHPGDIAKIEKVKKLIEKHIDINKIISAC